MAGRGAAAVRREEGGGLPLRPGLPVRRLRMMDAVRWDHGDRWSFHCRVSPDIRLGDVVIPRDNRQEASGRGKGAGPGAGVPLRHVLRVRPRPLRRLDDPDVRPDGDARRGCPSSCLAAARRKGGRLAIGQTRGEVRLPPAGDQAACRVAGGGHAASPPPPGPGGRGSRRRGRTSSRSRHAPRRCAPPSPPAPPAGRPVRR